MATLMAAKLPCPPNSPTKRPPGLSTLHAINHRAQGSDPVEGDVGEHRVEGWELVLEVALRRGITVSRIGRGFAIPSPCRRTSLAASCSVLPLRGILDSRKEASMADASITYAFTLCSSEDLSYCGVRKKSTRNTIVQGLGIQSAS